MCLPFDLYTSQHHTTATSLQQAEDMLERTPLLGHEPQEGWNPEQEITGEYLESEYNVLKAEMLSVQLASIIYNVEGIPKEDIFGPEMPHSAELIYRTLLSRSTLEGTTEEHVRSVCVLGAKLARLQASESNKCRIKDMRLTKKRCDICGGDIRTKDMHAGQIDEKTADILYIVHVRCMFVCKQMHQRSILMLSRGPYDYATSPSADLGDAVHPFASPTSPSQTTLAKQLKPVVPQDVINPELAKMMYGMFGVTRDADEPETAHAIYAALSITLLNDEAVQRRYKDTLPDRLYSCCILGAKIAALQKAAAQRRTLNYFDLSHVHCKSCEQKILERDQYVKIHAEEPNGPKYCVHTKCLFDNKHKGLFDDLANKCSSYDRSICLKGRSQA